MSDGPCDDEFSVILARSQCLEVWSNITLQALVGVFGMRLARQVDCE